MDHRMVPALIGVFRAVRKFIHFITVTSHGRHGVSNYRYCDWFFNRTRELGNTTKNIDISKHPLLTPRWRHQIETFSALLALCAGNSPVTGEFPLQRPVTRSFGVFFDLRLNERLSKQSWGWWFETHSRPIWHHSNDIVIVSDSHHKEQVLQEPFPCHDAIIWCALAPNLHHAQTVKTNHYYYQKDIIFRDLTIDGLKHWIQKEVDHRCFHHM